MNVTHIDAPLDPISASRAMFEGRDQADRALELLRAEFPKAFGEARVRAYGFPGRRQTRWIKGAHQLTVDEVRSGVRFDDAVARTAWPVELHDRSNGYVWRCSRPITCTTCRCGRCSRRTRTTWSRQAGARTATPPRCRACG